MNGSDAVFSICRSAPGSTVSGGKNNTALSLSLNIRCSALESSRDFAGAMPIFEVAASLRARQIVPQQFAELKTVDSGKSCFGDEEIWRVGNRFRKCLAAVAGFLNGVGVGAQVFAIQLARRGIAVGKQYQRGLSTVYRRWSCRLSSDHRPRSEGAQHSIYGVPNRLSSKAIV